MVKIPLFSMKFLGDERDCITVNIKGRNFSLTTVAVVDNGSPITLITENDLKRTRLPLRALPIVGKAAYGSMSVKLIDLEECDLTFRDVENEPVTFKFRVYGGLFESMPKNAYLIHLIPTIIGRDFLKRFNFSLKREEGRAFLET